MYPKPLSPARLKKLYEESGLTENQIDFLRDFFAACANLYGAIELADAWKVYQELAQKTKTEKIHKKQMLAGAGIMRREDVPFFVYEISELYSEEANSDAHRFIVNKALIGTGYGKREFFYRMMDSCLDHPYYVPEDLLIYKYPQTSPYEVKLRQILEGLKATENEYTDRFGNTKPCNYQGKTLKEFSYWSNRDLFELDWLRGKIEGHKGNQKLADQFEQETNSINAAQRLIRDYMWRSYIGWIEMTKSIEYFMDTLQEMGVSISIEQGNQILSALNSFHNHSHLWCNHGWAPDELAKQMRSQMKPGQPLTISFGPGIQKAFEDGSIDRDELIRKLHEMGIKTKIR